MTGPGHILGVDRKKWQKSRCGLVKMLNNCKPVRRKRLDLTKLFSELYAVKQRAAKDTRPREIWFPDARSRDAFVGMVSQIRTRG